MNYRYLFIHMLIFLSSTGYSMDVGKEKLVIKVKNQTPYVYYLKVPEEFVALKDCLYSTDEYQRWKVEPNTDEDIVLRVPSSESFSLPAEIKSLCPKDKQDKEDINVPCLGNIVVYRNRFRKKCLIHFRQKFHSSFTIESEELTKTLKLLITEKSFGGRSLLRICK